MDILRTVYDFITDDPQSMRLNAVRKRVREELGEIRYKTVADGRREMREDVHRLRNDFRKAVKQASEHEQESRTK